MKFLYKVVFLSFLLIGLFTAKEFHSRNSNSFMACEKFTLAPKSILVDSSFSEIIENPLFSVIENKGMDITRNPDFVKRVKLLQKDFETVFESNPSPKILIGYHDDADGVMSAKMTQLALKKYGSTKNFEFKSFPAFKDTDKKLKELALESYDKIIILDSFWAQQLYFQNDLSDQIKSNLVVIDHHPSDLKNEQLEEADQKNLNLINLNNIGYKGESKHMPASALISFIFTEMKDSNNQSLLENSSDLNLPLSVLLASGIVGDRGYAEKKQGEDNYKGGFLLNQKEITFMDVKTNLTEIATTVNWYLSSFKGAYDSVINNMDNITMNNIVIWIKQKRELDEKIKNISNTILQNPIFSNEKVVCLDVEKQINQEDMIQKIVIGDVSYEFNISKSVEDKVVEAESKTAEPRIVSLLQHLDKDGLYKFSFRYDGKDKSVADLLSVIQVLKDSVKQKGDKVPEFKDALSNYMNQVRDLLQKLTEIQSSLTSENLSSVLDKSFTDILDNLAAQNINVSIKGSKLFQQILDLKKFLESIRSTEQDPLKADERTAEKMKCLKIISSLTAFSVSDIPSRANEDWLPKEIKKIQGMESELDYYDGGGHSGAVSLRFDKKAIDSGNVLDKLIMAIVTDVTNAFYFSKTLRTVFDNETPISLTSSTQNFYQKSA